MSDEVLANRHDIVVFQGATWSEEFVYVFQDDDNFTVTPIDITGYTASGQIRSSQSTTAELLATMTFVIDAVNGSVTATIAATTTSALTRGGYYDVKITSALGKVVRLAQGRVLLSLAVTP